jgi:catechol 2,3-dioxygenase-like lactoylglutathione lyase family enzyme
MVAVESVVPTFFVASLGRSVDWYERVLGFTRACYLRLRSGIDEYVAGIEAGPPGAPPS